MPVHKRQDGSCNFISEKLWLLATSLHLFVTYGAENPGGKPTEEFELTVSSLGAHIETHGKLILRTLSYLIVNSQDDSHCELAVSFP